MKYALMFGRTVYVKRMSNLLMSKNEAFDGVIDLRLEFLFEGVPHVMNLANAERIHPDVVLPVEEYTPAVWDALCEVFDHEVEMHVTHLLRMAHDAGGTTWEVYQPTPEVEDTGGTVTEDRAAD